jgi:hypothetical protein
LFVVSDLISSPRGSQMRVGNPAQELGKNSVADLTLQIVQVYFMT